MVRDGPVVGHLRWLLKDKQDELNLSALRGSKHKFLKLHALCQCITQWTR